MIIKHNATVKTWDTNEIFLNANTLILGSFNPFNPNSVNPDYYYGRESNYFWKELATISNQESNYFYNSLQRKKDFLLEHNICLLDIIEEVEILEINQNVELLHQFVEENIFTDYTDQILFTSKTKFESTIKNISLSRRYNRNIFDLLNQGNIHKIFHTMGNSRINTNFIAKPKETALEGDGFQMFINSIKNLGIHFEPISFSPSRYAVNRGGEVYRERLRNWLNEIL